MAPFTCTSSFSNLALRKWDLRTTVDAAFSVSASAAAAAAALPVILLLSCCFGCCYTSVSFTDSLSSVAVNGTPIPLLVEISCQGVTDG